MSICVRIDVVEFSLYIKKPTTSPGAGCAESALERMAHVNKRIFNIKIHIFLSLLILIAAGVLAVFLAFTDDSPGFLSAGPGTSGGTAITRTPADSDDGEYYEPEDVVLFTTVYLDAAEISRGSLILVNADNPFTISNNNHFITIADMMTSSYRVASAEMRICRTVIGPLNRMMDAFYAESGLSNVTVRSAYRGYARQQELLDERIALVGLEEALRWVATPGHSEHHTGLAVDFGIYTEGTPNLGMFHGTGEFAWFRHNSYRFGFILRYDEHTEAITGVAYEPWHYRYVGLPHSYFIHRYNLTLEEYLDKIMSLEYGQVFRGLFDGTVYEIFYTRESSFELPIGIDYSISGSNIDGFFVTLRIGD